MRNYILLFLLILSSSTSGKTQQDSLSSYDKSDTLGFWDKPSEVRPSRLRPVVISAVVLYTGTMIGLNKLWYSDYPKAPMHSYDDWNEWRNMDKLGHVYSGYLQTRIMTDMFQWTGLSQKKSIIYGGLCGIAFQSIVEILDGYSTQWGFSWSDMGANIIGAGVAMTEKALWNEQRIQFKFSAHVISYPVGIKNDRADSLYGTSTSERILKDYNGQTYWYSFNPTDFRPQSRIPKWLNISIGIGAQGMYGGYENNWVDKWDQNEYSIPEPRYTQWYLSPDIDLTKIRTNKKGLKFALYLLNIFKIPMPTLQYDRQEGFKLHALYF